MTASPLATHDTSTDAEPAFDPAAFDVLVLEIGEEGASEVRAVFKSETEARLRRFREIAPDQQRRKIESEAHSLKSAAGSFGYRRLAALARELEKRAHDVTEVEYLHLLQHMDSAFASAMAEEAKR